MKKNRIEVLFITTFDNLKLVTKTLVKNHLEQLYKGLKISEIEIYSRKNDGTQKMKVTSNILELLSNAFNNQQGKNEMIIPGNEFEIEGLSSISFNPEICFDFEESLNQIEILKSKLSEETNNPLLSESFQHLKCIFENQLSLQKEQFKDSIAQTNKFKEELILKGKLTEELINRVNELNEEIQSLSSSKEKYKEMARQLASSPKNKSKILMMNKEIQTEELLPIINRMSKIESKKAEIYLQKINELEENMRNSKFSYEEKLNSKEAELTQVKLQLFKASEINESFRKQLIGKNELEVEINSIRDFNEKSEVLIKSYRTEIELKSETIKNLENTKAIYFEKFQKFKKKYKEASKLIRELKTCADGKSTMINSLEEGQKEIKRNTELLSKENQDLTLKLKNIDLNYIELMNKFNMLIEDYNAKNEINLILKNQLSNFSILLSEKEELLIKKAIASESLAIGEMKANEELNNLHKEMIAKHTEIIQLKDKIIIIESNINNQNSLIENIKNELKEEKVKYELLLKETNEIKLELNKLDMSKNILKQEKMKLQTELFAREEDISKIKIEITDLGQKYEESQTIIELLKNRIRSLEIKISEDIEAEDKRQKEETIKNDILIKNLEEKYNDQIKKRDIAEEEQKKLISKIKVNEEDNRTLKSILENKIILKENEIVQLNKENTNNKSEIEILKGKNNELNKINEESKSIIQKLNDTIFSNENNFQLITKDYINKLSEKDQEYEKLTNLKNADKIKFEDELMILKKENAKNKEKIEYFLNENIQLKKDKEDKENQIKNLQILSSNQIKDVESKLKDLWAIQNLEKGKISPNNILIDQNQINVDELIKKFESIVNQFHSTQIKNCELLKSLELNEKLLKENQANVIFTENQFNELMLEKDTLKTQFLEKESKINDILKLLDQKEKNIKDMKFELQNEHNKLLEITETFKNEKTEFICEILKVNKTLITLCQENIDIKLNKVENINKISKMLNDLNDSNSIESKIQILNSQKQLISFLKLIKITKDIAIALTNITTIYIENKQAKIMTLKNDFERLYQIQDNAKLKCEEYENKLN